MQLACLLPPILLLVAAAVPVPAQQSNNQRMAVQELKAKADNGDAAAQNDLGACYVNGEGIAKDAAEAVKWFRRSAEQNYAAAQYNLGWCYANGDGVAQGDVEAAKWMSKAAEQGHAQAQFMLGCSYYRGKGISRDYGEAVKWFRKSAEQGHGSAQAMLGACFSIGYGVPRNDIEAYKWLTLGLSQNLSDAVREQATKSLELAEEGMSREEIVEAQRLAREFKPRVVEKLVPDSGVILSTPTFRGTGFFISEDGFLVTNEHVAKGTTQVRLLTSAGLISAKVVKVDAANDLALLKAEGRFAALPVAASRGVKLGGTVATVGFPNIGLQGFAPKLAKGEIASLSGAGDDARYFQISVPVQPGNSGGALVDERGNVVGVVAAKLSARAALASSGALPENVNYAIKSSYLLSFLESVPEVRAKLKEPESKERKFEEVVKAAEQAAVLVLVY